MIFAVIFAAASLGSGSFPCGTAVAYAGYSSSVPCQPFLRGSSVPVVADVVGYSRPISVFKPSANIPQDASECAGILQDLCSQDSAWNKEEGWQMLLTASGTKTLGSNSSGCGNPALKYEAWNYCKCDWILSEAASSRAALSQVNTVREPNQLQVRLAVTALAGKGQPSETLRSAVVALELSKGMVKTGVDNQHTKQRIDVGTNDKMSIMTHMYDTSKMDITWYLQNIVTYGEALLQLRQVIETLTHNGAEVEVKEVLLNMKPTTFKEQLCRN